MMVTQPDELTIRNLYEEDTIDADLYQKLIESPGYFVVSFDGHGHGGGTYYYPASEEQMKAFAAGTLDYTEFYGW